MKKFLSFVCAFTLTFGMTACGDNNESTDNQTNFFNAGNSQSSNNNQTDENNKTYEENNLKTNNPESDEDYIEAYLNAFYFADGDAMACILPNKWLEYYADEYNINLEQLKKVYNYYMIERSGIEDENITIDEWREGVRITNIEITSIEDMALSEYQSLNQKLENMGYDKADSYYQVNFKFDVTMTEALAGSLGLEEDELSNTLEDHDGICIVDGEKVSLSMDYGLDRALRYGMDDVDKKESVNSDEELQKEANEKANSLYKSANTAIFELDEKGYDIYTNFKFEFSNGEWNSYPKINFELEDLSKSIIHYFNSAEENNIILICFIEKGYALFTVVETADGFIGSYPVISGVHKSSEENIEDIYEILVDKYLNN